MKRTVYLIFLLLLPLLQGCVGTILGAATDVVIETAKVPFKVGGAVIDLVTDDDEPAEETD